MFPLSVQWTFAVLATMRKQPIVYICVVWLMYIDECNTNDRPTSLSQFICLTVLVSFSYAHAHIAKRNIQVCVLVGAQPVDRQVPTAQAGWISSLVSFKGVHVSMIVLSK